MFSNHIQCVSYDEDLLCHIIREAAKAPTESTIKDLPQYQYLIEYLRKYKGWDLKAKPNPKTILAPAKTIIIENDYVDEHYSEDYSLYYSKSFQSIGKKCVRLHFFSADENTVVKLLETSTEQSSVYGFTKTQLYDLVALSKFHELKDYYQGFVVVRPIPTACFAKLCLAAYSNLAHCEGGRRIIKREIKSNLLGTEFSINGIPMIQQDKMVSECATAAIWTFLCSTTKYNASNVPSLGNITQKSIVAGRVFPARGLERKEISDVLHHYGFSPNLTKYQDLKRLKQLIFANTLASYAVLLGIEVYKETITENTIVYESLGHHLLAITGFQTTECNQHSKYYTADDQLDSSQYISAFYIHDDQFGQNFKINLNELDYSGLEIFLNTSTDEIKSKTDEVKLFDYGLDIKSKNNFVTKNEVFRIVDIYYGVEPEITSSFKHFQEISPKNTILVATGAIDQYHIDNGMQNTSLSLLKNKFVFSTSLRKGTLHKKRILEKPAQNGESKKTSPFYFYSPYIRVQENDKALNISSFLGMNLPKFVWRFRLRTSEIKINSEKSNLKLTEYNNIALDFLYDATALRGKHELIAIICYTKEANEFYKILEKCYSATSAHSELNSLILQIFDNTLEDNVPNGPGHNLKDFFKEIELSDTNKRKDNTFGMEKFCARPPKPSEQKNSIKDMFTSKQIIKTQILSTIDTYIANLYDHFGIKIFEHTKENIFIWLINIEGELLIAHEEVTSEAGKRGHFSLATYHKARIAGEFIVRHNNSSKNDPRDSSYEIEFNSNSSSYSLDFNQYHSSNKTEISTEANGVLKTLQNVVDLINPNFKLCDLELNQFDKIYYKAKIRLFNA